MAGTVAAPVSSIIEQLSQRTNMLGVAELAKLLGEHYVTTYRAVRRGDIPHIRRRNRIKFDPKEIAVWLQEHHT